ncbi:hypothetical protein FRC06_006639 [Ceratobasidium sp. 370]|nr:hypothetical protein FRC06_006639 [Ceratobasidium sp. 370]
MPAVSSSSVPFVREVSRAHADPVVDASGVHASPEPEPPRPSSGVQSGAGFRARGGLRWWNGLYIEDFPNPLAGAPISEDRAPEPDLATYMQSCGTLADLWNFEAAELLMTSGMTDIAKDRHLKSKLYEGQMPWPNVEAMNKDIDKLLHSPDFELCEIDIFDGRHPWAQFMVSCNIIHAIRDLFANPAFKNHFHTAPERHWLSPCKDQQMHSKMYMAGWWWREQLGLTNQIGKMRGKGVATIAPLIISSDRTQLLTMSSGQKAYPIYISMANIDKSVHCKQWE